MSDNPEVQPQHQQQEGVDFVPVVEPNDQQNANHWQMMANIINRRVVEVRQQAINNQPPAQPWLNLQQNGRQQLAIAGNNIPIEIFNRSYARLGDNYRVRARPVVYDTGGQQRWMVETNFPTNTYFAMFSFGINGYSGPQAELMVDGDNNNGQNLLVIDQQTAVELRNQSLNRAYHQSLIHQLIWTAYMLAVMSSNLYHWSDGDVDDQQILNLRQQIYQFSDRCIQQLNCAIRSKNIYLKAIVAVEGMDEIVLVNPSEPFRCPLPPAIEVPAIVLPNIQESVARVNGFVQEINDSQLFARDWPAMFDRLANQETSVPIIEQTGQKPNQRLFEQPIHLNNNHIFQVIVEADRRLIDNNQWTYHIYSAEFADNTHNNRYHIRPVDDFEPYEVMRYNNRLNLLPLHSHGLAGGYNADIARGGNNGFQVTTLNFPDVPELDHRRLYFVNRAMAMELRDLFEIVPTEPVPVMRQYHRWFVQLIEMSRLVCDMRQWYRGVANIIYDEQWLQDIQNCSQQLFALPDQLYRKYMIISRLEQLWYHSILVPNIQAREPKVRVLNIQYNAYLGLKVDKKRKDKDDGQSGGPSGLAGKSKKVKTN